MDLKTINMGLELTLLTESIHEFYKMNREVSGSKFHVGQLVQYCGDDEDILEYAGSNLFVVTIVKDVGETELEYWLYGFPFAVWESQIFAPKVICVSCGSQIDTLASGCPHCGTPMGMTIKEYNSRKKGGDSSD